MKTPMLDNPHCRCRVHCRACRDLAGGRELRRQWGRWWELPGGLVDFPCVADPPFPWGLTENPARPPSDACPAYAGGCCGETARCRTTAVESPACGGHRSACVA